MDKRIEDVIKNDMDEAVMPAVEKAMEDGATWAWDSEFYHIAALMSKDNETLMVLYIREHDAEVGEKFVERYM